MISIKLQPVFKICYCAMTPCDLLSCQCKQNVKVAKSTIILQTSKELISDNSRSLLERDVADTCSPLTRLQLNFACNKTLTPLA